ncbi:hypothetical protein MHYP_G00302940 [Metynnis hypsauchen]
MAPVFGFAAALARLSLSHLFIVFCSLLFLYAQDASAALVYDRQMLLQIRHSMESLSVAKNFSFTGPTLFSPARGLPLLSDWGRGSRVSRTRRYRKRRGTRAGVQVKSRRLWKQDRATPPLYSWETPGLSVGVLDAARRVCGRSRASYLRLVCPSMVDAPVVLQRPHPRPQRGHKRGGQRAIHEIVRVSSVSPNTTSDYSFKMCLVNARSVANKTHILNDLFTENNLTFLFLTETWQRDADFTHLNELCPSDSSVIGTPRLSGRGGGLAVVWKKRYVCQLVNTDHYSSFELQITKVGGSFLQAGLSQGREIMEIYRVGSSPPEP